MKNAKGMLKQIINFEVFNTVDDQTPIFMHEEIKKRLEYHKQCTTKLKFLFDKNNSTDLFKNIINQFEST